MALCNRRDCGRGEIDDQGFCVVCARRPLKSRPVPEPARGRPPAPRRPGVGVTAVRPDPWYGLDLADRLGPATGAEVTPPTTSPSAEPVTEYERYCGNPRCRLPVGRGTGGAPGRIAGYCPRCGTRFDFAVPVGEIVADRYEIEGRLGAGANGTAYLAHDRNLRARVVLKALKETSVASTAEAERDALVGLRHDSIVSIMGYESEGPYLVLEFVPGVRLSASGDDRLAVLLAHGIRILQALDYLHGRGLLHCDVKPSNVIRFPVEHVKVVRGPQDESERREGVRLIDFGSVRERRDLGAVTSFTPDFAPPEGDPERLHPTIGFDLFCLGNTLKEVCRTHLRDTTVPGVSSLRLLLARATDVKEPRRRFATARQFGEQLSGVIRQVVAGSPHRHQVTRPSALFGLMAEPLHGGLGAARPLRHWVAAEPDHAARLALPEPVTTPRPLDIATSLPAPLQVPDDDDVTERGQSALAETLQALHAHDTAAARAALAGVGLPDWHWLTSWYSGLLAVADGKVPEALDHFKAVRGALPGELIPQLALGLCAELGGDAHLAQSHYTTVFETTPALGAAAFGLARVHMRAGRRQEAVAVVVRLAGEFRYARPAHIAAVRLLVADPAQPGHPPPREDDVEQARSKLGELSDLDGPTSDSLAAEVRRAEFVCNPDRLSLSEAIRALAAHATTEDDHTALLDVANQVRPAVSWPWPRGAGSGLLRFKGKTQPLSS